ncbi:MAG: penicillin-binding protein 2 [Prevotellaceae bacterium]|jgi:penicillin-binding protein 2|nr:penicillin-binding protein 2 [Prevotellaceae bacterium]
MNEYSRKSMVIFGTFVLLALILLVRLFWLQVVDESYKVTANTNVLRYEVQYPARGLIIDRNGKRMVENQTTYDIMVVPRELKAFDTLAFCTIFKLAPETFKSAINDIYRRRRQIGYQPTVLLKQAPAEYYAVFQEKAFKFPGFYAQARTLRNYTLPIAGNLFGYVTEVDTGTIRRNPYYKPGDYIGKSGIEEAYEEYLRGRKGMNIFVRDVHNRIKESYQEGRFDSAAVAGKDLICTIDSQLQEYGEWLMKNKVGAIVAIEPSTGEVLALISAPGIDPTLLVGINKNFQRMQSDPRKPLFNRAIMSPYPPGSTFKLANALIGLDEQVVTPSSRFSCAMGYRIGAGKTVGCHAHASPIDMLQSIQMSCNAYYCNVFRHIIDNPACESVEEGFLKWCEYVQSLGFGQKTGIDLPSEQAGTLPSVRQYNRIHGEGRWKSLSIISLSIGQGEIGSTPLQMANFAATIANRGHYYVPHVVRKVEGFDPPESYKKRHYTMIDTTWFPTVVEGMYRAVHSEPGAGATARIAQISGIELCGKTGTAQNPHGEDHSTFICFAPRQNPQIAIAAYIENAGFGATWAAPIASLMVEKYLNKQILRTDLEQRIQAGIPTAKIQKKP